MSFEPSFTVTHAITADLTRIERARGFLEAATLSEDWIRKMSARALVLEAHHTTHIEGTRLTLEESEVLLADDVVPKADPDEGACRKGAVGRSGHRADGPDLALPAGGGLGEIPAGAVTSCDLEL